MESEHLGGKDHSKMGTMAKKVSHHVTFEEQKQEYISVEDSNSSRLCVGKLLQVLLHSANVQCVVHM